MTTENSDDGGWQDTIGLDDNTDKVVIYCKKSHKDEWTDEADEKGYSSRSRYLYELVMEARRAREEGLYGSQSTGGDEEQLRERIKELHDEISRLKNGSPEDSGLVTPDLVMGELGERYRTLDDLIDGLLQADVIKDQIRREVEEILYDLIDADRAEYQIGHGWRHVPEGDA
jgi:hypothetical protein